MHFEGDSESKLKSYLMGKKNKPHRFCPECSSSVLIDFKNSDMESQRSYLAMNVSTHCLLRCSLRDVGLAWRRNRFLDALSSCSVGPCLAAEHMLCLAMSEQAPTAQAESNVSTVEQNHEPTPVSCAICRSLRTIRLRQPSAMRWKTSDQCAPPSNIT